MSNTRNNAHGNWRSILIHLGVDPARLVNKHGPCPMCGGKDRFRWDDQGGNGGFICSGCGGGDGFMLAQRITGKSFKEVAMAIDEMLGKPSTFEPKGPDREEIAQRDAMRKVWLESRPIADVSPAAKYLRIRLAGSVPSLNFVREHAAVRHSESHELHPAMVAKVVSHLDQAVNLHVTYLSRDGSKANVSPSKKVMPGKLPDGCAIRLMEAMPLMGVAEGIETAISASLLFDIPVWACVNGNLLAKWIPPDIADEIIVFGDNDQNFAGQAKAYHLANRLEVQHKRHVKVMIPPRVGEDWNDYYLAHIFEKRGAGQV